MEIRFPVPYTCQSQIPTLNPQNFVRCGIAVVSEIVRIEADVVAIWSCHRYDHVQAGDRGDANVEESCTSQGQNGES
jgi:hypothetical protein